MAERVQRAVTDRLLVCVASPHSYSKIISSELSEPEAAEELALAKHAGCKGTLGFNLLSIRADLLLLGHICCCFITRSYSRIPYQLRVGSLKDFPGP